MVYETPSSREHAFKLCAHAPELCDDVSRWCCAGSLDGTVEGERFFREALAADLVIFAFSSEGDFSPELKQWIDRWLVKRGDREGAIIGIFQNRHHADTAPRKEVYLRHIAHQAGMDYLSKLPPRANWSMPDSLDDFRARAGQMTSVLDQILQTKILPPPML